MADTSLRLSRGVWGLTTGPTIWAVHFVLCYAGAAIFCAKLVRAGAEICSLQLFVAAATVPALAGIALVGWRAFHRWGFSQGAQPPHDADTPEDRERFLGLATLLLSAVSLLATVYTALAAVFAASCR